MKAWYRELQVTRRAYRKGTRARRRAMEKRALFYAAMCIHQTWRASFAQFIRGVEALRLPAARKFYLSRVRRRPRDWGDSPKAKFARTLCGASGPDDACFDVLMQRFHPHAQVSEVGQWALWLHDAYPRQHPNEGMALFGTSRVEQDHCAVLTWIRTGKLDTRLRLY